MASTATSRSPESGSGRISVDLQELIALRQRVAHAVMRQNLPVAAQSGRQVSARRGRGMDYLESRAYQPGDDVRHLDWRLTARSGSLHTKIFQEEGEHAVMLLMDTHASMRFGTRERFKSVQAARVAALAAWQVARSGGAIGALAFGDGRQMCARAPGRRGALGVCAALARWDHALAAQADAQAGEALSSALRRMRPMLHHASHAVIISDGHCCDAAAATALAQWRRHMRVSVLVVADALETHTPPPGHYPLLCAERRMVAHLDSARARADFRQAMEAPMRRLEDACRSAGIACRRIDTREDPLPAVKDLFGTVRRKA